VSLRAAPPTVSLTFTEEPDAKLSSIELRDAAGSSLARGSTEVRPGQARTLHIEAPRLGRGVYTVVWRVLSRVDGHFTAGAFAFGVRVDPSEIEDAAAPTVSTPPLNPLEPAGRFLFYVGLVAAVGACWVTAFVFGRRRRWWYRMLVAGVATATAGLVLLAWAQQHASDAIWTTFLGTSIGRAVVGRAVALTVVVLVAVWMRRAGPSRSAALVAVGGAFAAIAVHVSAGHAATGTYGWLKIGTQLVHFAAASVWIGGLAALLVGIRGLDPQDRARAVRRFSTVAGLTLAVVVGSGTARAVAEIGSWGGLLSTAYGRVVLAKVGLVGVIAALGARNRWRNVPEAASSVTGLQRTSRVELGAAVAVFGLTAVLSSLVPARSVALSEPASSVVLEGRDFARTVSVRLEIVPGYPGANRFEAEVEAMRGRQRIDGVALRLSSDDADVEGVRVALRGSGKTWQARSAAVAIPGTWRVVVFVDRGADSVEVPLEFHTRCRTPAPTTAGPPRIYDVELPGTGSVQAYIDPGKPGPNDVHFTFFDDEGKELRLADDPSIEAFGEGSRPRLNVRRFSAGHFVAGAELREGLWVFEFDGSTEDGDELNVCFEDQIS